ncbi:hypothetical protein F4782DRAFT_546905 [Xylaria castorea]|nr:hypothetical protein F4782DRAFT_546905 [Xylaria castorea]
MAHSASENLNHDRIDTQLHRPFNVRADTSWRKIEGGEKETPFSGTSTPIGNDHQRINEEQPKQDRGQSTRPIKKNIFIVEDNKDKNQGTDHHVSSHPVNRIECGDLTCRSTHTGHYPFQHNVSYSKHGSEQSRQALDPGGNSNWPPQVVVQKSDFDQSLAPEKGDVPHRHHSAGFHSYDHIAEHLSSAVGHNAYDLLEGRNGKGIETVSSKASTKWSPYLQPLTKPKPETTHKARNSTLEDSTIPTGQKETLNNLNISQRDNKPRKFRLVSTPPWLKNPTKKAADAIAPLHHINTKSSKAHGNDHAYAPNIALDDWTKHSTVRSTSSIRKAEILEERRLPPIRTHNSPSVVAKVPEPSHVTPKIQIDQAPDEHKRRHTPVSVSKRREIFEFVQDHADTASPVKKASHERKTLAHQEAKDKHLHSNTQLGQEENATPRPLDAHLRREGTGQSFISATHKSDQEPEPKYFAEQSSEPEIAKPTPIAPPNHLCDWKERYVALTAEIRQLKAEMSARASLKSSDILTPRYEQHGDNLDLLAVTVILHSRDRDDIVINTDVTRDAGPSNY